MLGVVSALAFTRAAKAPEAAKGRRRLEISCIIEIPLI